MQTQENRGARHGDWNEGLAPGLNAFLRRLPEMDAAELHAAEQLTRAMFANASQQRATDIHLEPFRDNWRVRYRIDGRLHNVASITAPLGLRLLHFLRTLGQLDPSPTFRPQDASIEYHVDGRMLDVRLAFVPCIGGEKVAIRLLDPNRVRHRVDDLGMEKDDLDYLRGWLKETCGMCLITGPTGSGKTTTLYALLRELDLGHHSMVTIEDPVEYKLDGITQLQINERQGMTFAIGLKAMLRLDPDFLVVGEMRDRDSARTAVEASASGHILLSTLHAADAVGLLTLFRGWDIPDYQIATVLELAINQRLVRRLCQHCREPAQLDPGERAWLEGWKLPLPAKVWKAQGCKECSSTGYLGRVGVFELWRRDESDYHLILTGCDEHKLRRHVRGRGGRTVIEDGLNKAAQGITTISELQGMGVHVTAGARAP